MNYFNKVVNWHHTRSFLLAFNGVHASSVFEVFNIVFVLAFQIF